MTGRGAPDGTPGTNAEQDAPAGPAFVSFDRGTASLAGALVGRVGGRRRLLAATAVPAGADPGVLAAVLAGRVRAADPGVAAEASIPDGAADLPRLIATGTSPRTAAVLTVTEATRAALEADAAAAGWRTVGASAERDDVLEALRRATRPDVDLLVVGTGVPPSSDERDLVAELVALAAGVLERRPGLPVVLVGAAAVRVPDIPLGAEVIPVARPRGDPGEHLRGILAARRAGPADARQALAAVAGTLAEVVGLRVEILEVGMSGALRARAIPPDRVGEPASVVAAELPAAALGFVEDDAVLDRVEAWTTIPIDRARLRDRLAEMQLAPWAELDGEGAVLRGAALRSSVERLVEATEAEVGGPAPDLVVLAGGAWSAVPAPAAVLVLADAIRRPGVVQVALDAARLLGPLGAIADPVARAELLEELLDDALVRLGTLVVAGGVARRSAGRLRLRAGGEPVEVALAGGSVALVDLPPGQSGAVELEFRGAVDLGTRGRRFALSATGGLAGLVVDLRDIPLALPERSDERREALLRWERVLWPGRDE